MKLLVKFFSIGMVYLFSSLACGNVVITGTSYGSGTPGGTYADNTPAGVGSYDMSQVSRGVVSQKASCQSALDGFDNTFDTCIRDAQQFRVISISKSQNANLPDNQALFNADVLAIDGQLITDKGTCTLNYNSKVRAFNSSSCSGLVPATTKPMQ